VEAGVIRREPKSWVVSAFAYPRAFLPAVQGLEVVERYPYLKAQLRTAPAAGKKDRFPYPKAHLKAFAAVGLARLQLDRERQQMNREPVLLSQHLPFLKGRWLLKTDPAERQDRVRQTERSGQHREQELPSKAQPVPAP